MEPRLTISFYNLDTDSGDADGGTVKDLVVTTHTGQCFALKCNDMGLVITALSAPSIDVFNRSAPNTLTVGATG